MIPPSALVQGLLAFWPYILGAIAISLVIGFAIPIKEKEKEQVQTIVKEEIQNNVKIVTKIHRKEVAIDYDVFLKMLSDYEKAKEDAEKSLLTQLALLEAKKEEQKDKAMRDAIKPEDAYKDLVKVKMNGNGKKLPKKDENEEEDDEIDASALYKE